ncbi:hypothetical protein C8R43DRAFT_1141841 [Mycena crocata]|nr:hypothetical protein C8R43DRAFT_1141833 [Mycena crocata]KAJ7093639.1 hypothetical protein C8R43DRAFT_1141841 [Mycena crocata]
MLTDDEELLNQRGIIRALQSDPLSLSLMASLTNAPGSGELGAVKCTWCEIAGPLYRCRDRNCMRGQVACASCTALAHERRPLHGIEEWKNTYWKRRQLNEIGYIYQHGHDGLPCPNPAQETEDEWVLMAEGRVRLAMRKCNCKRVGDNQ